MTKFFVCDASTPTFNHGNPGRQAQLLSAFNLIDSRYREVATIETGLFRSNFALIFWCSRGQPDAFGAICR
jgi:hypothetical protein